MVTTPITVEQYGAVGNGTTDDTAAIQAALNTGAPEVYAGGFYRTTGTLQLQQSQILRGQARANIVPWGVPVTGGMPRIKFRPTHGSTVAIKNATGTNGNGLRDIAIDMPADATNTAIQFANSYSNTLRHIWIGGGPIKIGVLAHNTYVCDFSDIAMNGISVAVACILCSNYTNAVTIEKLHTGSTYPANAGTCMYGIGFGGGTSHVIRDCVLQGPTIGIAVNGAGVLVENPFFEDTVCNVRFDYYGAGSQFRLDGGCFNAPSAAHPQYASRGPAIYLRCDTVAMRSPNFRNPPANTANGPWPIVVSDNCQNVTIDSPYAYTIGIDASSMIFVEDAGVTSRINVSGASYAGTPSTIAGTVSALLRQDIPDAGALVL